LNNYIDNQLKSARRAVRDAVIDLQLQSLDGNYSLGDRIFSIDQRDSEQTDSFILLLPTVMRHLGVSGRPFEIQFIANIYFTGLTNYGILASALMGMEGDYRFSRIDSPVRDSPEDVNHYLMTGTMESVF